MALADVEACRADVSRDGGGGQLLCTYEGIVYDVTQFAESHPGGKELLTAAGLDLKHFFDNYTVHGHSDKAARWLAPLAVGKLSPEDALASRSRGAVDRRMALGAARRRLLAVAAALPWPSACASFSPGSEPLPATEDGSARGVVAVVGGGIAGCSAAWMLARDGFEVHLYEARPATSGNARTFDWVDDTWTQSCVSNTGKDDTVKSCVSVTAWPPLLYKNYTALLAHLNVETVAMPLSWFLNSKVPGYEGTLWGADPRCDVANGVNTLRSVFANDFRKYAAVELFARRCTEFFTLAWAPWKRHDTMSMYTNHTGLGMLNPLNVVPLYSLFKGAQIPLNPTPENSWHGASSKTDADCKLTTCVTWKDAGTGIRAVFAKLVEDVDVKVDTRVLEVRVMPDGTKRVVDEHDGVLVADRVIFACPCNAAMTMLKKPDKRLEETVMAAPYRSDFLDRGSNYVEVTKLKDGSINIENQYNFGIQTPGPGVYDLPLDKKPVMLISHALGEGKKIDETLVRGGGNHSRAHPLYSGGTSWRS
ncbi:hypothetical protein JL722_9902 [Aureococcus anophagefferens]|nr:hypothetical protein JL722_9902 [Aureococcus anophagefferens]